MTLLVGWDGAGKGTAWGRQARRLATSLRLWQRGLARRRLVSRVMAETHDPEVMADMGIRAARPSHAERWIAAMLWHQH